MPRRTNSVTEQSQNEWHGRRFLVVPAAYSSQTCAVCGHIDPKNRDTQAAFRCLDCGHTAHADFNAACVLRQRGLAALDDDDTSCSSRPRGLPGRVTKARPVRRLPQRPATRTHPVVDRRTDPPNAPPSGRRA